MHGIKNDKHTLGGEPRVERVGDLLGQTLLQLRPRRERLDNAGKTAEADHAIARNVRDVGNADERQQVVLADRPELDVAQQHELAALALRQLHRLGEVLQRVLVETGEEVAVRLRDPLRGRPQSGSRRILADRSKQLRDRRLDASSVNSHQPW